MYHSLTIGEKNTYDDFGLIPTSRPIINPPEPRTTYIEIPGRSGRIDLSESLTGTMCYSNRTGSIEFLVPKERNWMDVYTELLSYLHGKFRRVILEDDPLYYYEGRLSVSDWNSSKNHSTIKVNYDLAPFKYRTAGTVDGYNVLAKTFNNSYLSFSKTADTNVYEIIVDCKAASNLNITAQMEGITYQCKQGENILPILQKEGAASVKVGGTGEVTIRFRNGRL